MATTLHHLASSPLLQFLYIKNPESKTMFSLEDNEDWNEKLG